ncbi:protein of unknown function [Micropruina glycogenica]|uniref:Uncharacterized protein n=1 Tax=Micropruina glycogenica TaxID=75385 RepID=A0A2N9JKI0_9ACTN|nr:protein of unknown function [Micropruina glycogenica]
MAHLAQLKWRELGTVPNSRQSPSGAS